MECACRSAALLLDIAIRRIGAVLPNLRHVYSDFVACDPGVHSDRSSAVPAASLQVGSSKSLQAVTTRFQGKWKSALFCERSRCPCPGAQQREERKPHRFTLLLFEHAQIAVLIPRTIFSWMPIAAAAFAAVA